MHSSIMSVVSVLVLTTGCRGSQAPVTARPTPVDPTSTASCLELVSHREHLRREAGDPQVVHDDDAALCRDLSRADHACMMRARVSREVLRCRRTATLDSCDEDLLARIYAATDRLDPSAAGSVELCTMEISDAEASCVMGGETEDEFRACLAPFAE